MYTTSIIKRELLAEGTMLFELEKPSNFDYKAGQSIDLTLVDPEETDNEGNMRSFSIVSAPHEPCLEIATRLRDTAFKRIIRDDTKDTEMMVDGPFGSFFLHENTERPAVFISGGIGITPFYSMIKDAAFRKTSHAIVLFYSNRRPEDTAFLSQLQKLEEEHPTFKLVATMTDMENSKSAWDGESGYIDKAMLERHIEHGGSPVYYLAGPPAMVASMRELLGSMGISSDDVRFEEFAGY